MAITRKTTDKCAHYIATRIVRTYMENGKGMVLYINGNNTECCLPVTPEEYNHITTGAGTAINAFDNGLMAASRYYYCLETEALGAKSEDEDGPASEGVQTVVAVHAVPIGAYMDCDWSVEMSPRRVPTGGAICTFRENGGIDINCFPVQFRGYEQTLLTKMVALPEISSTTTIQLDEKVSARVRGMEGNEATFVLKRA